MIKRFWSIWLDSDHALMRAHIFICLIRHGNYQEDLLDVRSRMKKIRIHSKKEYVNIESIMKKTIVPKKLRMISKQS